MARLTVKASARFKEFTPALLYILNVVYLEALECTSVENIVITSVNDSGHSKHSRHYTDEAIDIQPRKGSTYDGPLAPVGSVCHGVDRDV